MTRILHAALGYVERHPAWPVCPAIPGTKLPRIKTGTDHANGPHMARSVDQIRDWHRRGMLEAIGMPSGEASGVVVIDCDRKHDGEALLAELEEALGSLPKTRTVRTQSGGLHVYCAHPGDGVRVRTGAGDKSPLGHLLGGRSGVDVRADGGWVMLPPSCGYKWIADDDEPLPSLPQSWLTAIQGAVEVPTVSESRPMVSEISEGRRIESARHYLAKMPPSIAGSGGDNALWFAICHVMHKFDLDDASVRWLIVSDFNPRCDPQWSLKRIDYKISEARADANPDNWKRAA